MSNDLNVSKVKVYCPRCQDIFVPKGQRSAFATGSKGCKVNLDGAYFGTSFPYIFLMNFTNEDAIIPASKPEKYEQRIYGFKMKNI